MPSGPARSSTELNLLPSPGLALALGLVAALSIVAAGVSALPLLVRAALILAIALTALFGIGRFLHPGLGLRLLDAGLEYRERPGGRWYSLPPTSPRFASPWYAGWLGRGWRACGVFKWQLEPEQFRRLLVALRQRPAD